MNLNKNLLIFRLNPINLLNQLKYRYDIEIGNAKRSSIKRIIEKDDTSMNKSLILFVSKIIASENSSSNIYIELCDGWYPVRALCDSYLTDYVKKGKIKIGDKLIIFSAELIGCPKDGCTPLEVFQNFLKKFKKIILQKTYF